jgi:sugar phosphate permease
VDRRALVVFGLAPTAGGLALHPGFLVTSRVLHGVGAFLFPATLALVNSIFAEGPERTRPSPCGDPPVRAASRSASLRAACLPDCSVGGLSSS